MKLLMSAILGKGRAGKGLTGAQYVAKVGRSQTLNCFSVQPLCSLCLCGESGNTNHRDTENTEVAQRNPID